MKKLLNIVPALLMVCACSPQVYNMFLDVRYPSESGLDLDNKTMSIVYLDDAASSDSLFNTNFSDGVAKVLEHEYFDSKETISLYSAVKDMSNDYTSVDSLRNLVLGLDSDVVLVVDTPEFGEPSGDRIECTAKLYAYDSMFPMDDLVFLSAKSKLQMNNVTDDVRASEARSLGMQISRLLLNKWKEEGFSLLYFDNNSRWDKALRYAEDMKWDDALSMWMYLAENSKKDIERSCAAYDCGIACYMLRQFDLALEWFDLSDKIHPISLTNSLKEKVKARM